MSLASTFVLWKCRRKSNVKSPCLSLVFLGMFLLMDLLLTSLAPLLYYLEAKGFAKASFKGYRYWIINQRVIDIVDMFTDNAKI